MTLTKAKPDIAGNILFKPKLVDKIYSGEKTHTRRLDKVQKYQPGDIVRVRETHWAFGFWAVSLDEELRERRTFKDRTSILNPVKFSPDLLHIPIDRVSEGYHKRPSIFLKNPHARTFIRIAKAWQEPLQSISEEDAIKEGISLGEESPGETAKDRFRLLWDSINKKRGSWESNPDVWCYEFENCSEEVKS